MTDETILLEQRFLKYGSTQTWVVKGRKMGCAKAIQICQTKFFSFHFSSSQNSVID